VLLLGTEEILTAGAVLWQQWWWWCTLGRGISYGSNL